MSLYHYEIGFPAHVNLNLEGLKLTYSRHALHAADCDNLQGLPSHVSHVYTVIEIELQDAQLTKAVIRTPYDALRDLILVLNPDGKVRTVWTNERTDTHKTLDRTRYTRPIPATKGSTR